MKKTVRQCFMGMMLLSVSSTVWAASDEMQQAPLPLPEPTLLTAPSQTLLPWQQPAQPAAPPQKTLLSAGLVPSPTEPQPKTQPAFNELQPAANSQSLIEPPETNPLPVPGIMMNPPTQAAAPAALPVNNQALLAPSAAAAVTEVEQTALPSPLPPLVPMAEKPAAPSTQAIADKLQNSLILGEQVVTPPVGLQSALSQPVMSPEAAAVAATPVTPPPPPQTIAQQPAFNDLQPAANAPADAPHLNEPTNVAPEPVQASSAPLPWLVATRPPAPLPAAEPAEVPQTPPAPASIAAVSAPTRESAFHDMLVTVYQQSPRLRAARYVLNAQDERVSEATSNFRPTVSANGDIGRQREQTGSDGWIYGTARDESLVVSQPIYNGNGNFAQFHAARARVSAERAHLITVEEEVFLDAITAYLDVVAKEQILEFTRQNRMHLQGYVTATDKRLKAGDGTRTDLAQAQSRLSQGDTAVATAEANWIAACATYKRNTGLDMTSSEFPPLPENLPDTAEDAVDMAKRAPEFTQAAEQERAASHDIDLASSSLYPTVSLRGSMNSQLTPSLGLQNLRSDVVTLNVSVPLYQGGAEHARVREARELREKAHEDMMDTSRFMTERASQAWHNYYASYLVIDASTKTTEAANRALQGVEIEHQQGLRTMQDTLDARAEYLNSLIAKAQAEQNLYLQAYRLMSATGQLTASALHLGTPIYDPKAHYDRVSDKWAGTK